MALTWGQLKEVMKDVPDERIIVVSKDGEGNSFSPLEEAVPGRYQAETTWSGEAYTEPVGDGYGPEDWELWNDPSNVDVYIFWPTN